MNKQQALSMLTLIADLYAIINQPEPQQIVMPVESEVVFPNGRAEKPTLVK